MKHLFLILVFTAVCFSTFAQSPQSFQYQAVVRDASGTAMVNQPVNFQVSIISGSITGTVEYVETHSASTNAFGVVTLNIGTGTATLGTFNGVTWGTSSHYIKVEADPTGGTSYLDMGTTQLLSVPYALYSEKAGNIPTYTGGTGIDVTGTTISNTSPDQNVTLTQGGATTVSGTYPNFTISSTDINTTYNAGTGINVTGTTISNTLPDQTVNLTQGGATTITGTYPNYIISSTDNNTTYNAGTGMSLTGTTFNNTAPDQTVTMTSGTGISITGSYPSFTVTNSSPNATHTGDVTGSGALTITNDAVTTSKIADGNVTAVKLNSMSATNGQALKFNGTNWAPATDANTTYSAGTGINITGTTITNTAPNQVVSLTQGGATTVSGAYPNFTISSTDLNSGTPGGLNKTVQFNNAGVFAGDTALVWDNTNKRLGIGTSTPLGRVVIKGSPTAPATEPLFEVKNSLGQQIMAIYNDSIHFFITDIGSNRGGFAVSGRNNAKALTNDFLRINADSTRIWTSDTLKGFGVRNIGATSKSSYMQLTPSNYFIGHQSGLNINVAGGGLYNCYYGYQSGKYTTTGNRNIANGYQSLYNNTIGNSNVANGYQALYFNTSGVTNVANGYQALYKNNANNNVANGYMALYNNTTGSLNVANGYQALYQNTTGWKNTANGDQTLYSNTTGYNNTATGTNALIFNTTGYQNTATGNDALANNTTGYQNTATGNGALINNTTGLNNVANGHNVLYLNTTGSYNVASGFESLYNNNSDFNVASGYRSMYNNTTGNHNTSEGYHAMFYNTTGSTNVAIGNYALYSNTTFNANVAIGDQAAYYAIGGANTAVGQWSLFYNTGSNNTALGFGAFFSAVPTNYTNSTAIGNSANITASNQVKLGNNTITSFYCQGAYAATTALAANMYVSAAGQIMRSTSSKRYKKNIENLTINTEDIYKLRPVSYVSIMDNKPYFGLIAEEVAEVISGLAEFTKEKDVIKDSKSEKLIPDAVQYPMLSVLLLNEVQKHQKRLIDWETKNKNLETIVEKQQDEIEILKKQIESLNILMKDLHK